MMRAMDLKSPAPIQFLLRHLKDKDYIDCQEGKVRTIHLIDPPKDGLVQRVEELEELCQRKDREIERLKFLLQQSEPRSVELSA